MERGVPMKVEGTEAFEKVFDGQSIYRSKVGQADEEAAELEYI